MANPSILRFIVIKQLILILLLAGYPSGTFADGRIASVQSISISPYEEAIDGFTSVCTIPMDRFLISDLHSVPVDEEIRQMKPDLILAVGLDALNELADIHETPIVFVMLLCPENEHKARANVTGVSMRPSADVQLGKIHDILPDIRNIGMLFNPHETGEFVENASRAADHFGIDIIAEEVATARDVPARLARIQDRVQMIWMIPDVTVITRQTVEFFLLFSMENRIPLIAFSEKYVDKGAFMAFVLDPEDMGRQAGDMANSILSGKSPGDVPVQEARKVSVTVNRTMAKKFGILLNENRLETVKLVE